MAAPASSAASPGKLLSQMDLSKAQAGAEMAPADPAAHLTAAAAPVGEAHGSCGARAAGLGARAEAGLEPCLPGDVCGAPLGSSCPNAAYF